MKKIVFTILFILLASCPIITHAKASNKPAEEFANLVFFAYFDGTSDEINEDLNYYKEENKDLLDYYEGTSKRSLTNYLKEISYGKFKVKNIFPQVENGIIKPIKLNINIENSYKMNNDTAFIEQIIEAYPSVGNKIVDYNGDGYIDNLTVILKDRKGYTAATHSSFVSHKGDYPEAKKYLNKLIGTYNVINTDSIKFKDVNNISFGNKSGVIAHEFLHSLGYPDLYRSDATDDYPVHIWDIMASANQGMSYPLAYLRKAITNWVDIETITESTTLRLDLQSNPDGNQAFILKSPLNDYEYFVVEYRKKDYAVDLLDRHIGGSGIIVYRVDTTVEGLSNHYGKTGVYVFRPQTGFSTEDQKVYNAHLFQGPHPTQGSGRTSIGSSDMNLGLEDGALTFTDGSNSGIVIKNVSKTDGDFMTLDVEIPKAETFDLWQNKNLPDLIGGDENTDKKIALTNYKNKLYAVSSGNNRLYTQCFENNKWIVKGTDRNVKIESLTNIKVVELNQELYLVANNTNMVNIYKWKDSSNTWTFFSSYQEMLNDFEVSVIHNRLYLAGSTTNKAILYVLNNNVLTKVGDYYTGMNGIPKIGEMHGEIYVSTRSLLGDVLLYQYKNNQFNLITTNIKSNHYDLKSLNNKLYITSGTTSLNSDKLSLKIYDGTNWETVLSSLTLSFPNMVSSEGNLYILGTDKNYLYTYSYQEATKKFVKEGSVVDTGSDFYDTSLVALKNSIYVGIRKANNTLLVKAKEVTNNNDNPSQKEDIDLPQIEEGTYVIRSALAYNKVLDVSGGANCSGANVQLYDYNASNAQVWNITYLGDGYYTISSQINPNLVLDVSGGSLNSGANVQVYSSNHTSAQQWLMKEDGNGYYYLISKCNGLNVDINCAYTANGTNVQMYQGNGTFAQKFRLDRLDKTIENGNYVIRSALNNNKVLDVQNGANYSGTNVQLYDYNATKAQIWNITYLTDGYYKISSQINNNLVLDVSGGSSNNGANVQVYSSNNTRAQQWFIKDAGNGYYYLVSRCGGLNLDIAYAQTANGTNIQMYQGNGTNAQKFRFELQ